MSWLHATQPNALAEAQALLRSDKKVNLDQLTQLYPPESKTIRGVMEHDRIIESLTFTQLTQAESKLSTVTINPIIAPDPIINHWIPGFQTKLPHQQQIYAVIDALYTACTQIKTPSGPSSFQGAILYGHPGTGKTMACNALVQRLEREGHPTWQTDFHEGATLLTFQEQEEWLTLLRTQGEDAYHEAIIQKFKAQWDKAEVLFIDDTNNPYDALSGVSNAALIYARQTGKKVLVTCNTDPISLFRSSITFPVDAISIRHIQGPDWRKSQAWYPTVSQQTYAPANTIQHHAATPNQQIVWQWLQALDAHPGHHGVAFYGPPGIGKTTALKAYFAKDPTKTIWIESHTLYEGQRDLSNQLAQSDAEYLIIDDCNDPKGNTDYGQVLFDVLNHETLVNKQGKPVRVVLVSNRENWQALVGDTTANHSFLSPRMESRYHGRFASVELAPDQDFRVNGPHRGVIIKKEGDIIPPPGIYLFSLARYAEERAQKSAIWEQYQNMRSVRLSNGLWCSLEVDASTKQACKDSYTAIQNGDKMIFENISDAQSIVVDMTGSSNTPWTRKALQHMLDVMEARPDYHVTIVTEGEPHQAMQTLQEWMNKADRTGKYTSRLQRLHVAG